MQCSSRGSSVRSPLAPALARPDRGAGDRAREGGAPQPAGAQAPAQSATVFPVSDIAVDATAADAVSARAQAVREGQQAGLDRLLRRLVAGRGRRAPAARSASLPIDDYVQSFEIANEELSSTRYIARAHGAPTIRTRCASCCSDGGFAFAQTPCRRRWSCCRCTRPGRARACGRTTIHGGRPGPSTWTPSSCSAWCCRWAISRTWPWCRRRRRRRAIRRRWPLSPRATAPRTRWW